MFLLCARWRAGGIGRGPHGTNQTLQPAPQLPPRPSGRCRLCAEENHLTWKDGGAYALLGPSGCGKSTLLNIISGLLIPSEGQILFNDQDVTALPPAQRNIAQVFQFPVIYDTMTVYDNLAFPLRNRGRDEDVVKRRVTNIAEMLEVTDMLNVRASNLSPDNKQKISMGRGLVREDVNVVMFDEPLTVIDPHLKWKLRSKLKELHQRVKATMIYVTHDQTEALTFADQVVVMQDGEVVQIGTPVELFERPAHTFVGHFIGSPSMNVRRAKSKAEPPSSVERGSHWKARRRVRPTELRKSASGRSSSPSPRTARASPHGFARCPTSAATRFSRRWPTTAVSTQSSTARCRMPVTL